MVESGASLRLHAAGAGGAAARARARPPGHRGHGPARRRARARRAARPHAARRDDGGEPFADPFAYDEDAEAEMVRRAAAGTSHALYARSPGGATATARRVAAWRPQVESRGARGGRGRRPGGGPRVPGERRPPRRHGRQHGGRRRASRRSSPRRARTCSACTSTSSAAPGSRGASPAPRPAGAATSSPACRRERRAADERYDPAKALAGTGRYLAFARARLGRRTSRWPPTTWASATSRRSSPWRERRSRPTRASTSTPRRRATRPSSSASRSFGDESSTYLCKVHAAAEIMRLYRRDPSRLARLEALHARKALRRGGAPPARA